MNFKQKLSWKILLPIGIILWILFSLETEGVLGDAISFIGFIMTVMGIIDLIRVLIKKKRK